MTGHASDPDQQAGSFAAGDEDPDPSACPTCGVVLEDRALLARHLAGLDGKRPECARQDLVAIAARERRTGSRPIDGDTVW